MADLSSRVVHIRLSVDTIVGCYDVAESVGINPKGWPTSSLIAKVLAAFLTNMRRTEVVPTYSDDAALLRRAAEIFRDLMLEEVELPISREDFDLTEEEAPPTEEGLSERVREALEEAHEQVSSPIPKDASPPEEQEPDLEVPKVGDWSSLPAVSFTEIEREFPLNNLVQQCKGDSKLEHALGVVYKQLPQEMWGSQMAEKLFLNLIKPTLKESDE